MEQLTLEQAAENHSTHDKSPVGSRLYIYKTEAFKAGANWQKEQYLLILQLAFNAANELDNLGAVYLCNDIKTELERLQTI